MPGKTRIFITRHGLSEHNLNTRVFMGRSPESRLTDQGKTEARRLGDRLASRTPPDRIICSSLPRTMETGEIIARQCGLDTVIPEDAFWELSKGNWEGSMPRELPADILAEIAADPFGFRYGQGESYQEVVARVAPVFDRYVETHVGETLLFVLHGDVVRAVLYHAIRFPGEKISDFTVDPCSISELILEAPGQFHTVRLNDTAHLEKGI